MKINIDEVVYKTKEEISKLLSPIRQTERDVVDSFSDDYLFLARNRDGTLMFFKHWPRKVYGWWEDDIGYGTIVSHNEGDFRDIKWADEDPTIATCYLPPVKAVQDGVPVLLYTIHKDGINLFACVEGR